MPEGPEIYSYWIELRDFFIKNQIKKIKILSGRYLRKKILGFNILKNILPSEIISSRTYGKILIIELKLDYFIIITFGMSGYLTLDKIKHNHICFNTSKGKLYYNDQRNFGNIYILNKHTLEKKLSILGPDILSVDINFKIIYNHLKKYISAHPEKYIGISLLDQTFICGIGNYLRADILYLSKISPYRKLKYLTLTDIKKLYTYAYNLSRYYTYSQININKCKNKIIRTNLKYKLKYKPIDYNRTFLIYGQKIDIFNNPISKDKLLNRSIYWVKKYQK
jgi:formamidopyrimidine-DNA glycosylase